MENISTPAAQPCPNPANRKENHQTSAESQCARVRKHRAGDTAPGGTKCQPSFAFPSQCFSQVWNKSIPAASPHWALPELPAVIPHLPAHTCPVPGVSSSPSFRNVPEGSREFSPLQGLFWMVSKHTDYSVWEYGTICPSSVPCGIHERAWGSPLEEG